MYVYVNKNKIIKVSQRLINLKSGATYADAGYVPTSSYKELIIEDKPVYNETTEELLSWFEDGDVITQKFKVVKKED